MEPLPKERSDQADEPFGWREIAGCILILGAGLIEGLDQLRDSARKRAAALSAS